MDVIRDVSVAQYYSPELEEDADEKAIAKYMKQIARGAYDPILVKDSFSITEPLDGCHRVIAAHRLGKETIRAIVEPSTKKRKGR